MYVGEMAQLNVSLPPALKSWIDHRVAEGRYSSPSDYVRDLVRKDQAGEPDEIDWLRGLIAEGLESPIIDKEPEDIVEEIIAERRARHG